MDEHDAHGVALLVVRRRGEAEIQAGRQREQRRSREPGQKRAAQVHEARGIGVAEHALPFSSPD